MNKGKKIFLAVALLLIVGVATAGMFAITLNGDYTHAMNKDMLSYLEENNVNVDGNVYLAVKDLKNDGFLKKVPDKFNEFFVKINKDKNGEYIFTLVNDVDKASNVKEESLYSKDINKNENNAENIESKNNIDENINENINTNNNTNSNVNNNNSNNNNNNNINNSNNNSSDNNNTNNNNDNNDANNDTNNDNNNDNNIPPLVEEDVPKIILEPSNVYEQELGEPKNELGMQVITKDKNINYGVDDSKVDYSKVGKYSVRFFARTFATNRQVEKVMPFAVVDTKAPTIAIVPERTENPASNVAIRINVKDPSVIKNKKYVWLDEDANVPVDTDPSWKDMTAENIVVETKDFNALKEGTLSIAVQATDALDNKATVKAQKYVLSQLVPKAITFQPSTTEFTNQDVQLTINFETDSNVRKYKIDNQGWQDYTGPVAISSNCTVLAQATNGNFMLTKSLQITNIDKVAPEKITITAQNMYLAQIADLTLNITAEDSISGFKANMPANVQYKWIKSGTQPDATPWTNAPLNTFVDNAKAVSFSVTNSIDKGLYTLHVKAADYAGNVSTKLSEEYNLYNYTILPPTFVVTPATGWVKDKVTLEIHHNASEAGEEIYYSEDPNADKTTWTKYTAPIEITEHKTIYAYVKAVSGKLSEVSNYVIQDRIDKVKPSITIGPKTIKTNSIAFKASVTDNVAGVDLTALKCKYKKNADQAYTTISADAAGNIQLPNLTHNTLYNIELEYADKAGNVATVTDTATTLLLDTPVISIDKTDANWYKQKIATIDYKSYKDNLTYKYKKDSEAEIVPSISAGNLTIPVTFTSNGSISATVTDGTNTLTANANITNVDSVIPVILTATANNITYQTTDINIVATETLSGIVKYMYRYGTDINAAVWTEKASTATTIDIPLTNLTQLTAYTFEVKTVDKAGNESIVKQINFTTLEEPKFKPIIKQGLTPIKWDGSNALKTTTDTDKDWFDYQNKKWANAQTGDGSMWTWIPRYAYRIIYYDGAVTDNVGSGNIIGYSDNRGLVDASGNPSTAFSRLNGRVEVVFLGSNNFKYLEGTNYVGDVRKTGGTDNPKNYVVHPAFSAVRRTGYTKKVDGNFGWDAEIPGFWVSKFEMSKGCASKSGVTSEREITSSAIFDEGKKIAATRKITGGDSMGITNTQWGAVAYLTKAMGKEPYINPSSTYITGNGDYITYENQSTTGNVTGIYDMSGSAWEMVSAYIVDLYTVHMDNLKINKDTKYVDVYSKGDTPEDRTSNYQANTDKYGDAQYEVSSNGVNNPMGWSGDISAFPFTTSHVFCRGGNYGANSGSGVFAFATTPGQPDDFSCWRRSLPFRQHTVNTLKYHSI